MGQVRVGLYCRISIDQSGHGVGVERQREDCTTLARSRWPGCTIEEFVDNDISAADPTKVRPAWQELLSRLRGGDIDEVVAYDQSRLTRQPAEWEQLLIVLARRKIGAVHTVREGDRSITEGEGRLMSRIVAAVDAEYVEVAKMRMRRASEQLAREGRPAGGRHFGYLPARDASGRRTLEIVPEEAAAIRWAAEAVLRSESLRSISREFNRRGLPQTKKGKGWTPAHIKSLLIKPSVAALRRDPEGLLIPGVWEPILERPTWMRVQGVLSSPIVLVRADGTVYRTERRRRSSQQHLLTRLAICGVCGAPLAAQRRSDDRLGRPSVTYLCNPRYGGTCVGMVAHFLEPIVTESVFNIVEQGAARYLLAGRDPSKAAAIAAELEGIDADLRLLAAAWGAGRIRRGEWADGRSAFTARAEYLRDELARLAIPGMCDPSRLREEWPALGAATKRAILYALIDCVVVHRTTRRDHQLDTGRVEIFWNPPLEAPPTDQVAAALVQGTQGPRRRWGRQGEAAFVAKVTALYASGQSMKTVAGRLGVSPSTVERVLEAAGVPRRRVGHRHVPQRNRILHAYKEGASVEAIARQTGVGRRCILRLIREEGIARTNGRRLPWAEIVARYHQGETTVAIAADLGTTSSGVCHVLASSGIPRRPPGTRSATSPKKAPRRGATA
jgi:DNA invertase Pin-like site-specific DNA recombinase